MNRALVAVACALSTLSGFTYADDLNLGRNLVATCAACHGTDGHSAGGNAKLAGVEKVKLVEIFRAFKSGEKPATVMSQLAKGYNDAQVEAIAAYLSAQK